jgi:putative membrane protein
MTTAVPESPWWTVVSIVIMCAIGAMYGKGIQELWLRRGTGEVVGMYRALMFAGGLATMAAAVTGPVHELAERSFSGHMIQHMLFIVVAAPLLGAGGAALPITLAVPRRIRRPINRLRAHPASRWLRRPANRTVIGGVLFTGGFWIWHLPALYVLAVRHPAVHALEHVSFVAVAWMLWAVVLTPDRHRLTGPLAFLLLFAVGMAGAALGAVLTFAPSPLYPPDAYGNAGDALADQQLAGLIMWVPMDLVVLVCALGIFRRWLDGLEQAFPRDAHLVRPAVAGEVAS